MNVALVYDIYSVVDFRPSGLSYKDSGVDISAGDALVDSIKPFAAATSRPGCTADLGMFGGIFDVKAAGYKDPLLVSGTDGVGTKLKVTIHILIIITK